ncbi:MAG: InlB B-repeat-containing protein, partial [Bacteroidales bacterium]|nr:InlB B-repeat-containing protein [Bacteroidales bacterium]
IDATDEGWQHILTSDNTKIIASIKTGDVDLGNLNVEVFVDNKQQLYKDPLYTDDIGEWYMNRHFRITYSNNVNIKADQDICIRLYFTNDEYHAFMDSTSRIEHFEDIKVYRYTNNFALPMVDGVLTNNDRSSGTWVNEEVKSRGETYTEGVLFPNELDSIHYIEFVLSGGRYSEFWLTDKDMITYTVKYLPNGNTVSGQPPVDNNKYPIYTTLTVQGNLNAPKLTRPGAVFMGWSTRQITFLVTSEYLDNIIRTNDYYGYYDAGANYKITKNTIFYAVWAVDEDENGLPDYEESPDPIYVITYNGNNSTVGTPPTDENEYTPSTSTVIVKGKGTLGRENAVFIGWSETKIESIIGTQTEYDSWAPSIYEPLDEFPITDTTEFYAVWAVDANGNGTPDYEETGHRVTYDGNGSTAGAVPTDATLHLDGVTVSVRDNTAVPALSKTKAVFIGWSFTKYNVVIATQNAEDVADYFIPGQTFTMGDHDTTLFAVWAADTNSNGLVDYKEPKFAVIYTDNIGAGSLLYTDDNYITNTTAKVLDLATKGVTVIYANHVLLGFARAAYPVITTQSAEDVIASEILSEGDELTIAGHDITLYAVWAIDMDNNGTPDYQDGVVHVTYEGNGNTSGTVPTDATDYGVGTNITLATAGTMVKTNAVLLGWTKEQHTVVISTQNAEDLLTIYAPGSTYQLNEDQLFYALWAEDLNHNGTPDYKDASYILTYDLNGAVGSTPAPSNHAGGETVTAATVSMTKAKAVFIGWSLSRYTSLVTTQDLEDLLQPLYQGGDNFTMPTRNCTMYAIWAADANENGQPDYDEGSFTVTFLAGANGRIVGTYYFNNIVAGSSWESVVDMPTTKANTGYEFDYWRDKNGN